jgi:hypothetical protein
MAKELPYFKFEPSKWDNGNIQLCSFEAQGIFINLCCIYWSRMGDLPLKLAEQKLFRSNAHAYTELMQEEIFAVNEGKIVITFLDEQLSNFGGLSETKAKAAKARWDKVRESQQVNADALHVQSTSNAIREEERREEKKKKEFLLKKETKDIPAKKLKIEKLKFGEFQNVLLTEEEYYKAQDKYGDLLEAMIQKLSSYIKSKGDKYKDHYATFSSWVHKSIIEENQRNGSINSNQQNGNNPQWSNGATAAVQRPAGKQSFVFSGAEFSAKMQERFKNKEFID